MKKLLIIHGLGLDMRGKVQTAVFGTQTLDDYNRAIAQFADEAGVEVEIFHSNIEGEVINRLYAAHDSGEFAAALFNPGGYSSGHSGVVAAIAQVDFPVYEIHISNPAARGGQSQVATVCRGVVTGFGIEGYRLGIQGALSALE